MFHSLLAFFSMPLAGFVAVISYKATKPQEVTAAMTSGLRHRVGLVQRKLLEVPKYNRVQFLRHQDLQMFGEFL